MGDDISTRWSEDWMDEPLPWRLRDLPDLSAVPGGDGIVVTSHEAADTIEHLDAIIDRFVAEIERLRNAIDSVLINIDSDHQPEWSSAEVKAAGKRPWCCQWCGPQDGSWPCVHRMVLDELKEARRG